VKVHAGWAPSLLVPKSHLGASHFVAKHRVHPGYLNGLSSGHPFASLHCFGAGVGESVGASVGDLVAAVSNIASPQPAQSAPPFM
jgi:hypothetical protein